MISFRELSGLALSALAPGLLAIALGIAAGNITEAIWAFPIMTAFAFAIAVFIGLPAILLFNYFRNYSIWWYFLTGVIASLALGCYFILPNVLKADLSLGWSGYAAQYIILLILSLAASTIYWFVVRPDKIHMNKQ